MLKVFASCGAFVVGWSRQKDGGKNMKNDTRRGLIRISDFGLPSDFGFRISDFPARTRHAPSSVPVPPGWALRASVFEKVDGVAGHDIAGIQTLRVLVLLSMLSFLVLPSRSMASPSGALREYKSGNYDDALKEYERLLKKNSDDPRLQFNTGAAAYRSQQFDEAIKKFDHVLRTSPDLDLQQSAYYNRGNSFYWLGEQSPDAAKKTENWEKAIKDFESSVKLNPQDADAKFNQEFVRKRLEELKQQQQQQQQQQQSKSDKQDKNQDRQQQDQQQQNQQQQDQQSNSDNSKSQDQQNPSNQQSRSSQTNQPPEQAKQDDQKPQQANQPDKEKQPSDQQAGAGSEQKQDKSEGKDQEGNTYAAGQMTPEEARQLLDAQKDDEQTLQLKPERKPTEIARPFKDW
jgi:Ca-activated chloride channel homolog